MIEDDEDVEKTIDEKMEEVHGTRFEWEADAKGDMAGFSNAYREFLSNGCRGILTYEEAVEEYKTITGQDPESVTDWPTLDWVKSQREQCAENEEFIRTVFDLSLDEYFALYLPYEPMLRDAY